MTDDTEAGQSAGGDVLLHEADDADIDAYLNGAAAAENAPQEETTQPQASDANAVTPTPQPQGETTQPQTAARETDSGGQRQQPTQTAPPDPQLQIANLQRQLSEQETFIKRRNQELGTLRQQLLAKKQEAEQLLDQKFLESPRQAVEDMRRLEEFDREVASTHAEEQALTRMHQSQALIAHHFKPDEVGLEDMVQCLTDDGVPPQYVAHFQANPWTSTDPHTLLQIAKRARAESTLRRLVPMLKELIDTNKQLKSQQGSAIRKVESAFRQPPPMTAANGGSHPVAKGASVSPEDMNYNQLVEFLANN